MTDSAGRWARACRFAAAPLVVAAIASACTDVGDNTAGSGDDGSADVIGLDVSLGVDSSTGENVDSSTEENTDAQVSTDGTLGEEDGGPDALAVPADTGGDVAPSEGVEAAGPEASGPDAAVDAMAPVDATIADTGTPETGAAEAGGPDATTQDTGAPETGAAEAGGHDSGGSDAHAESGADTGGGTSLVPCTTTGQANCVKCDQNTNGVCTGTEAIIVQRDIEKGLVSGTTPTADSCYECAATGDIIDSQTNVFTGLECEDLAAANVQQCYDALNCILGSPQSGTAGPAGTPNPAATATSLAADCSNAPPTARSGPVDGVFNCFCGSAETDVTDCKSGGTVAAAATGGLGVASPNGVCIAQVLAGTGTTSSTSNTTIIGDLSGTANAAAVAFSIPQNAGSNLSTGPPCPQCYQ